LKFGERKRDAGKKAENRRRKNPLEKLLTLYFWGEGCSGGKNCVVRNFPEFGSLALLI
jgi:hypothetical protein